MATASQVPRLLEPRRQSRILILQNRSESLGQASSQGFVFSETQGLELSDNGLDIMPGEVHAVSIGGSNVARNLDWTYVGAEGIEEVSSRPKL